MNTLHGRIDVIVEDKHGRIKQHVHLKNNLTQAALAQMLVAGLSSTESLNSLFHVKKNAMNGQTVTINKSSPLQLYCITDAVAIAPKQNHRCYLDPVQRALYQTTPTDTSRISFHTDADEPVFRLHPHNRNCAVVGNLSRFTFEYRSDADLQADGYIRGIVIGVAATDKDSLCGTPLPVGIRQTPRNVKLPFANRVLENPNYAVQHVDDDGIPQTIVWKSLMPHDSSVNRFNVTTGVMLQGSSPNFFYDSVTNIDFSGGLVVPGDVESNTFTVVKAFLKGAENLTEPVFEESSEFVVDVSIEQPGENYRVGDTFTILDGLITCTVIAVGNGSEITVEQMGETHFAGESFNIFDGQIIVDVLAVDNGGILAVTAEVADSSVNPLGDVTSMSELETTFLARTDMSEPLAPLGSDAVVGVRVKRVVRVNAAVTDTADWTDESITAHYDTDTGLTLTLAWRCTVDGTPSEVFTKDIPLVFPTPLSAGTRVVPVMVWRPATDDMPAAIEIFYTKEYDPITLNFSLYMFDIDPFTLGSDPEQVVLSQQRFIGQIPYVVGHKTPRIDGQCYVRGFYDPNTGEYYLPVAMCATPQGIAEMGVSGALLGIRVRPRSGVLNAPAIVAGTIRNYEIMASLYHASDDYVRAGLVADHENYHHVHTKEGVGQMVLYGTLPNKAVQYVNLDYVWAGATLPFPIDKATDDLLRVIYSYELGNA